MVPLSPCVYVRCVVFHVVTNVCMCVCVFDGCTLSIGMTVLYYTVGPKTGYSAVILQMSTDLDEI